MRNKFFTSIFFIISFFLVTNTFIVSAYDKMEYKNLGVDVIGKGYEQYKNENIKILEELKNADTNIVKIKTVFDFNQEEFDKQVKEQRAKILSKIERKSLTSTGVNKIDKMINKLEKSGKYVVINLEGDLFLLNSTKILYLYKYNILGKEELIDRVKSMINLKRKSKKATFDDIYALLDEYHIKYLVFSLKGTEQNLYIGRQKYNKKQGREDFFFNKSFTTPFLKNLIDDNKDKDKQWKNYIWTYVTNDELRDDYQANIIQRNDGQKIETELDGNQFFTDLLGRIDYIGEYTNNKKVLKNTPYKSSKDIFIYSIEQNKYEYYILFVIFILGIIVGNYLLFNFINNFKNNFKKTPEEI